MTAMPLVLLHGFTGAPESWSEVVAELPQGREVHCEALLGHHPAVPLSRVDFEAEVDRLAARLPPKSHLVGYSMGARLALGLLVRHGTRFERATLIGVHPGLSTADAREERLGADEAWAKLLEREGVAAFVTRWEAQPLFASQSRLSPERRAAHRSRRLGHRPEGLACALRSLGLGRMPDYRPALGKLQLPVQLIAGAWDEKFSALANELAAVLPRARVRLIGSAGHDVSLEQPRAVAAALLEEAP